MGGDPVPGKNLPGGGYVNEFQDFLSLLSTINANTTSKIAMFAAAPQCDFFAFLQGRSCQFMFMSSPFARIDIALLASAIIADEVLIDDSPPARQEAALPKKKRATGIGDEEDDDGER